MAALYVLLTDEERAAVSAIGPDLAEKCRQAESDGEQYAAEIATARDEYCNDDVEIDDDPRVSAAENGAWVMAWVWVHGEDAR